MKVAFWRTLNAHGGSLVSFLTRFHWIPVISYSNTLEWRNPYRSHTNSLFISNQAHARSSFPSSAISNSSYNLTPPKHPHMMMVRISLLSLFNPILPPTATIASYGSSSTPHHASKSSPCQFSPSMWHDMGLDVPYVLCRLSLGTLLINS